MDDKATAAKKPPKVLDYDASAEASWGVEEFPLRHPFKFAGVEYTALRIRVPSGADMARFIANRVKPGDMLMELAEIDEKVVEKMRGSDYSRALMKMGEFTADI